ncbi:cytochrome-c peroxidase [Moraxella nasovis]|uniref:cytochrome-c peroxidase n=1 Tax=Moraxella nasovis TaxID=2904121 RepID=UPI001F61B770|nr:cytochrome-c peroxidase [Moraxella nasovis]UNU72806.1 cytochrome-c peroxidase [Moraxella nasovis]
MKNTGLSLVGISALLAVLGVVFLGMLTLTEFASTPSQNTTSSDNAPNVPVESLVSTRPDEPIKPIALAHVDNPAMVELGKKLWFDTRLSKSGGMSCNSCHNLAMGGTDNMTTSIGHKWAEGPINSPTVLNSGLAIAQFWDGRAKTLQEQAGGPIENPLEMASSHEYVVQVLNSIPAYKQEFQRAFDDHQGSITIEQVTQALASFEDTLVTPNSRFDKWLAGDDNAINEQELRGYQTFKQSGCVACHNGELLGGGSFQKFGVFEQYTTKNLSQGRFAVTGKPEDKMLFKVPTLRNIELTYPYFHDGQVNSLEEAVRIMGKIQLNKEFTNEETADIVAFLKTLTGDQPNIQLPNLPPSNTSTPKPNPFGE